ncbi:WS/DGAT/MGAT family O-acyltransferase [Pseudohalioglobus lutimaris]|uniref:diacylglycerol O-acyltransferase n=1 Tax=Pseudohalioglobus lutimaris TaxID=1737061 RepID=A0A2N5X6H4_9GAMM|nr:wax ester/triacylglycerol synthase family O-acyltransferase [Pseudohalioglobus lutimaris]PLW70094.1 wax ester/triacylglycerol synthase family O-acyltransferase [Pseudohalioglobus lutimaris]
MKQLGILDAAFINLEQNNTPQHVGGLGIYDPSTAPGGFVRFKDVISSFERRLNKQPLFRTRLVEVPGGLDRPYWVKDANFDVEFHLRHIALPEPGDWRQLCIQVARLHSRPLDMSRPLWEAYIIEGLDNIPNLPRNCFAIYTKMHHALVDGAGGSSFMALLHDLVANPGPDAEGVEEPRLVDAEPSVTELLTKASVNTAKNTAGLLRGTVKNTLALGRYAVDVARKEIPSPDISAPRTILNKSVGPHRVVDAAEFPLDGFKDIKNAADTTINDAVLAVVGGALKRYLDAKGEAPAEGSLATGIPLNMRTRRDSSEDDNNQVGSVFASLHTDIDDPMERLRAIHQSCADAKKNGEHSPLVDMLKIAGVFSPAVTRTVAGIWSRNELSKYLPVNISTVVTNVMGPDFPLYCAGAKLVDYYGLGVLTPGMGLFHAAFSYAGKLTLTVLGDRSIMPDPEFYHDCLIASYEELYAAATENLPASKTVKARAKIDAPRRKRAADTDTGKKSKPTARKKAKPAGTPAKKKTTAKQGAPAKKKAAIKKKTPAKKKAAVKSQAPAKKKAATRRKAPAKVKPKLK